MYSLMYGTTKLAEWVIPAGWVPVFGTVLAVSYQGKLTLFRAMGRKGNYILLDLY